jgi:hypothetical protein
MIERAGQGCAIETALFEAISQPYAREGQRTGALRFGDPRVMALAGALGVMVHAVSGFTNKSLRCLFAGLLGADYTPNQMTYDLRRLRLHGLIMRLPRTNTYVTTPAGLRAAIFYTKVHDRVLAPLLSPDLPPAPQELRSAIATIDHVVKDYVIAARLKLAACKLVTMSKVRVPKKNLGILPKRTGHARVLVPETVSDGLDLREEQGA